MFEHVEVLFVGRNSCVCGRGYYHIVSTAALLAMAGHEVCGLIATYLGSQQTQALIPHLKSRCLSLSCKFSQHWHAFSMFLVLFQHTLIQDEVAKLWSLI